MADDDQNYAVFNSRMLVDTVGDITDEALKASRIKDIIGVLAGRIFNWGQRKSLFPLHPATDRRQHHFATELQY